MSDNPYTTSQENTQYNTPVSSPKSTTPYRKNINNKDKDEDEVGNVQEQVGNVNQLNLDEEYNQGEEAFDVNQVWEGGRKNRRRRKTKKRRGRKTKKRRCRKSKKRRGKRY